MSKKRIVIVGFMGSGKTSVARELAMVHNERWIDLDAEIEKLQGRSPAQIIVAEGETVFREIETAALQEALSDTLDNVISLGGGAWTIERNRQLLREHDAVIIWLDAPFVLCWERIEAADQSRPLASGREAGHALFSTRRSIYSQADLHVQVTDEPASEIAKRIALLLQQQLHI